MNVEVSGRLAAMYLGRETAGVRFHTAEATGSKPVTPTIRNRRSHHLGSGPLAACGLLWLSGAALGPRLLCAASSQWLRRRQVDDHAFQLSTSGPHKGPVYDGRSYG